MKNDRFKVIIKDGSEHHGKIGETVDDWIIDGEKVGWIVEVPDGTNIIRWNVYGRDVTFWG